MRIAGAGPTLLYYNGLGARTLWAPHYIPLWPDSNWSLDPNCYASPASDADVTATLSGFTGIYINADRVFAYYGRPDTPDYGHDTTDLDNVFLSESPETPDLVLAGLGLGLLLLRRLKRA